MFEIFLLEALAVFYYRHLNHRHVNVGIISYSRVGLDSLHLEERKTFAMHLGPISYLCESHTMCLSFFLLWIILIMEKILTQKSGLKKKSY